MLLSISTVEGLGGYLSLFSNNDNDKHHNDDDNNSDMRIVFSSFRRKEEMFYLMTHSTHFMYGYMASVIW